MPSRLPLFPLTVVLFPGTPLPLHIFEPRYRKLLADCLAGDRRFGILPPGKEQERPDPGTVGCVAEVRVNQELPDGRANVVVIGLGRFVLTRLVAQDEPYLVGLIRTFEDEPGTDPPAETVERLRAQFLAYLTLFRQLNDVEPDEPSLPDQAMPLSFHVAAGVDCDAGVKQRLLIESSTARRCEALLLLLPVLTSGVESALRVHRRAHTNGRGTAHPNVVS